VATARHLDDPALLYLDCVRWLRGLLLLLTFAGCTTATSEFARRAGALGMTTEVVRGTSLRHVVFRIPRPASRRIHVYLGSDGTPWLGGLPARDPTPRMPLALALMARDSDASLYLGRPCYHGLAEDPGCTSALWTSARYSERVVASMAAAMRRIVTVKGIDDIVWFGYSGGGSLAVLLARHFPESTAVITVSANLNIDAWTDARGDARLTGSLNPAREPPLPGRIVQIHYAGGRDRVVPVDLVRRGVTGVGRVVVMPKYDHVCCWEAAWPTILAEVERATRAARR
jgi:hypothetical protein